MTKEGQKYAAHQRQHAHQPQRNVANMAKQPPAPAGQGDQQAHPHHREGTNPSHNQRSPAKTSRGRGTASPASSREITHSSAQAGCERPTINKSVDTEAQQHDQRGPQINRPPVATDTTTSARSHTHDFTTPGNLAQGSHTSTRPPGTRRINPTNRGPLHTHAAGM